MSSPSVLPTLRSPRRPSRIATAARIALGAVFAVTLLAVPQLARPAPVAAASCTGWTSKVHPPRTIKVLRTKSGRIDKVDFRTYVGEVMASGEWPTQLRSATLEAGAVATKQYAWYYALKGNHRPSYMRGGRCYDVRDDTADQLYRPGSAEPTSRQRAAIRRTWGLSLRKNGRFFLTGYRQGSSGTCGIDANGWKLYARSVEGCARKGWGYKRILRKYLNPKLTFVWSNGPLVRVPVFNLKTGTSWSTGIATVKWQPVSRDANVAKYQLQRKIGTGQWRTIGLSSATAKKANAWVRPGVRSRFRVRATDAKGRRGPWSYSARRKAALRGPIGTALSSESEPAALPITIRTSFDGRSIALMSSTGPGMGRAKVFVNRKAVAIVDLDHSASTSKNVVWARNFPKARRRSVAVKSMDPGTQVDFEGFFILR